MNFSNELKNKASYSNMKYTIVTESGVVFSADNIKEVKQILKTRLEGAVALRGRFGISAITTGNGKATCEGTAKFNKLASEITFN